MPIQTLLNYACMTKVQSLNAGGNILLSQELLREALDHTK